MLEKKSYNSYNYITIMQIIFRFTKKKLPVSTNSSSKFDHSCRNMLAPVRLPSPPMTTKSVILCFTKLAAAFSLPARVVKSLHLALPMTVPPYNKHEEIFIF